MGQDDHVYSFGDPSRTDVSTDKMIVGGKGSGLAEMTRLGLPVPPGFTIGIPVCLQYLAHGTYPGGARARVDEHVARVEKQVGARFGDADDPLLLSVRSGAPASMPGMMDTILNLGLNDATCEGLARRTDDRRFAFDSYRRFIAMYGDVVLDVPKDEFEHAITAAKTKLGNARMLDVDLPAGALEQLVVSFKAIVEEKTGKPFPVEPHDQLWGAISAVFGSWNNKRAVTYRRLYGIPHDWGTAVNVQSMVFGNMGGDCGTGVAFTRDPATGQKHMFGEWLPNAQGEDVVAGIRTPRPVHGPTDTKESLQEAMPSAFDELAATCKKLEGHFRDMQDVEFTVQHGKLWMLQTRAGKRTARAAVRVAVEMANEGMIHRNEAVLRVDPTSLDQLLHPVVPPPAQLALKGIHPIASGLPASPGGATGRIVFFAEDAEAAAARGEKVVLVRRETSPEDVGGMKAAVGILTATGGMTSHAAVVARGMGKPCVAGVSEISVDYAEKKMMVRMSSGPVDGPARGETLTMNVGDVITIDGARGKIYAGEVPVEPAAVSGELEVLMAWADSERRLRVRANADTPHDASTARAFGAEGIGLCRTEHMFFAPDRLETVRLIVLAETADQMTAPLAHLLEVQRSDFEGIFRAMDGLPVTVRLLDWPLHEFMPRHESELVDVARLLGTPIDDVWRKAQALKELNPMLGHRGVRLGLTLPSVYRAQTRAIMEAATKLVASGVVVKPEIMIPVVAMAEELAKIREVVVAEAEAVLASAPAKVKYLVGTMIELPRACIVAGELAEVGEFFSFGTNDLTQTTFGVSRDDAGKFLPAYAGELGLMKVDPFATLDEAGVGALVEMACRKGRARRPDLKLGICGEHGGDPQSIAAFDRYGLDYVSCSPFRVPTARLAAAQSALRLKGNVEDRTKSTA